MIEIVSGTRMSEAEFWEKAPLGISLRRLASDDRLVSQIAFSNSRGLPDVYNDRISSVDGGQILVFVHDDVWIDDYFIADRVTEGLKDFDIVGVAGNRRRVQRQPGWAFVDTNWTWDDPNNLTGAIAHGAGPGSSPVFFYGSVPAECELLDGVFLAARKGALTQRDVLFDPDFPFHFYDLDFCRTARAKQLRLGTWPICLTHRSGGAFGTAQWARMYRAYLEKWGE